MDHKNIWFAILILTIFLGSSFSYVYCKDANSTDQQVIIIVVNKLSFTDKEIYDIVPGFKKLEEYAAKGAMNINSAGSRTDFNSYLSISAGNRGVGLTGEMGRSFLASEIDNEAGTTAGELYIRQTGRELHNNDTIVFLPIENLKKADIQRFSFSMGIFGELLNKEGLNHRVYGNNDTDKQVNRYAALITMNQYGISYGDVSGKTLISDKSRPYGVKTNYDYLLERWEKDKDKTSLVIFDLGDLYRLEQYSYYMSSEYEEKVKNEIFGEIGNFIEYFFRNIDKKQTLVVLSPMVNNIALNEKELFAPIWIYNIENNGNVLTSDTTKREGIVANIDIVPTILCLFGIEKDPKMLGEKIRIEEAKLNLENELSHITRIYSLRGTVLYNYVILEIAILILATFLWIKNNKKDYWWIRIALISLLFIPCMLLLTAYLTPSNPYTYLIFILLLSLIVSSIIHKLTPVSSFILVGGINFIIITVDILLGAPLMKRSFMGYDPMIGARYYGIGNEYMGVYIGSALLFIGAFLQRRKDKITLLIAVVVFVGILFLLSYPTLGTNAGGTIAAIFAIGVTLYKIFNLHWSKKRILLFIVLLLIITLALFIFNSYISKGEQSHIDKAVRQLIEGDFNSIIQTIQRKMEMNWKLIQVSIWSKVMLTSLISLGILFWWPKNSLKILGKEYEYLYYSLYGILTGAFVSLFTNDSGIVAASTMIIYLINPILHILLLKKTEIKI